MVTKFFRPKDSPYPKIYQTFKAKSLHNDELVEFHIQDLTEDHFEKAIEMFVEDFMPEETFQVAVDLAGKDFSAEAYEQEFSAAFKERCSLGCFVCETNELVGVDACHAGKE